MGLVPFNVFFRDDDIPEPDWCQPSTGTPDDDKKTMKLVFIVVIMTLMGSTLYVDGFLRLFVPRFTHTMRLFLGRFNLEPIARILLHFAFIQFLPLLSSVFSSSKDQHDNSEIFLILLWMLLVELIRKKVQGMMLPTNGSSFSRGNGRFTLMDYSEEATRLVWVGFLIYTTLGKFGLYPPVYAVFIILWSLGLVKLVQRAVNTWLASGSWHTARNPLLIAAYMQHITEEEQGQASCSSGRHPCDPIDMSECKFVVMGEEKLVMRDCKKERRQNKKAWVALKLATNTGYGYGVGRRIVMPAAARHQNDHHQAQGRPYCDQNEQKHFHVHLLIDRSKAKAKKEKGLVTVGNIWKMHKNHPRLFRSRRRQHLEDLCLSFSLFKMLRRRFEHYPMVEVGSTGTRNVMLQGLLNLDGDDQRPFQVLQLELEILINYYQQAAAPVVMSQPILFFCNFLLSIIFLSIFTVAAVFFILLPDGDIVLYCKGKSHPDSYPLFLKYSYPIITILLLLTVMSIETYEFWTVYVFSNWNIVRLLCSYGGARGLRRKVYFLIIAVRFFAHSVLHPWFTKTSMKVQQVSIVDSCGALDKYSARATPKPLPAKARTSIIQTLKAVNPDTGIVGLPPLDGLGLQSGGETTSTEIILACHLATELLEMTEHRHMTPAQLEHKAIASVLSKYCMYLVAHVPQLLPDDETWIADRHEDVRSCLEHVSRHYCFIFCAPTHECRKENALQILKVDEEDVHEPTTRRGLKLFRELEKRAAGADPHVWKQLACFWVGLLVYLAPSNDVQGHARALATWGSDLITCLWAFCTHAGITRQPLEYNDNDKDGMSV
ncbi:hypothetical protein BAE44_0017601 [Dichanthelium oligosanthes]|uniref:DUF4220 domain-containing protein n=1 Tax=Dichanthelium oligosanthes TaxID=888268 RepID=A0A1E5V899_9POAL|nr:hypothetical protein BAE44_0017601 [Dichanthelium oligosanthes]